MNNISIYVNWLVSNTMSAFLQKYKNEKAITHSCMVGTQGGKFNVKFEDMSTFHDECINAYSKKIPLFLSERVPSGLNLPFKYFMDIDFDEDNNTGIPERDVLVDTLVELVYTSCKTPLENEAIVSFRGDFKMHINFPNIIVTRKSSKVLGAFITEKVSKLYPLFLSSKSESPWKIAIDSSVYNSGLRTLVSRKKKGDMINYYTVHNMVNGVWTPQLTTKLLLDRCSIFADTLSIVTQLDLEDDSSSAFEKQVISKKEDVVFDKDILSTMSEFCMEMLKVQKPFTKAYIVSAVSRSITFPLTDRYCIFQERKHTSNNCYVLLDSRGTRFKCHSANCKSKVGDIIELKNIPLDIQNFYYDTFKDNEVINQELILNARQDCKANIKEFYPSSSDELIISEMSNMLVSEQDQKFGKCIECHEGSNVVETLQGGWRLRCVSCNNLFPEEKLFPISSIYGALKKYFLEINFTVIQNIQNIQNVQNIQNTVVNYSQESYSGSWRQEPIEVFQDKKINDIFKFSLGGSDNAVTVFLVTMYGYMYHGIVTPVEKWYAYKGHRWIEGNEALYAFKKIPCTDEFTKYYRQAILHYKNQNIQDDETKKRIIHLERLIENFLNHNTRCTFIRDALGEFSSIRPNFLEMLDTKNLMVFENGVYDFDKMSFRDGVSEDLITLKSLCNYFPLDMEDQNVQDTFKFLRDIFPNEEDFDYVLKILSLCLTIDTSQQYFFVLTGTGGNGKSKLMSLLENCLGGYHGTSSPELLTRKRENSNQANESLASLEKKRVLVISEAAEGDIIQANLMKQLTGEDSVSVRKNYGSQIKFHPKFKILFICNDIPKMSEDSLAVWRRVKVIGFSTKFVEVSDENVKLKENERPRNDKFISHIMANCRDAFISILVDYQRKYKLEGLTEPSSVSINTRRYKAKNQEIPLDLIETTLVEKVEVGIKDFHGIKTTELQSIIEDWAVNNLAAIPKSAKIKKLMLEYFKDLPSPVRIKTKNSDGSKGDGERFHGWKGYRYKTDYERP